MTSIFNTVFSKNIERVNSHATAEKRLPEETQKGFSRVLADLEKKPEIMKHSEILEEVPAVNIKPLVSPTELLTNIEPLAKFEAKTNPMQFAKYAAIERHNLTDPLCQSVKYVSPSVKTTTPDYLPNTKIESPERPQVIEASRIAPKAEPLPPASPEVLSVTKLLELGDRPNVVSKTDHFKEMITVAGRYFGLDPHLSMAVAHAESAFKPDAVSRDGHFSKGLFQLLDTTGKEMHEKSQLDEKYDPFDPAQNTYLGMGYLRRLHDIFSEETRLSRRTKTIPASSAAELEKFAVAAFNAGEGSVARAQAKARDLGKDPTDYSAIEPFLPASTRAYVKRVTTLRQFYAQTNSDKDVA